MKPSKRSIEIARAKYIAQAEKDMMEHEAVYDRNDLEWAHQRADEILCEILFKLDYHKLLAEYQNLSEWSNMKCGEPFLTEEQASYSLNQLDHNVLLKLRHISADEVVCNFLTGVGCGRVVEFFKRVKKWTD